MLYLYLGANKQIFFFPNFVGLGCGSGAITVLVCGIGHKQLEDRVNIVRKLRAAKITADHCHCMVRNFGHLLLVIALSCVHKTSNLF